MKPIVLAVLIALVAPACLPPAGTIFKTTVSQPEGAYPMPVVLGDQTGLITAVDPALGDNMAENDPHVAPDPDDPTAVIVTWIGGACDDDVAMSFQPSGAAFLLRVDAHVPILGSCMAVALIRGLRIRFSKPIPASEITATGTR